MSKRGSVTPFIATTGKVVDHEAVAVEILVGNDSDRQDVITDEYFTGVSKCDPSDRFDPQIGVELAYWRAVERAAKKNISRLDGLVKHRDDVREEKKSNNGTRLSGKNKLFFDNKVFSIDKGGLVLVDGSRVSNYLICDEFLNPYPIRFKDQVPEFHGNLGYVIGKCGSNLICYHPDINWMGNHITYWRDYDLSVL